MNLWKNLKLFVAEVGTVAEDGSVVYLWKNFDDESKLKYLVYCSSSLMRLSTCKRKTYS